MKLTRSLMGPGLHFHDFMSYEVSGIRCAGGLKYSVETHFTIARRASVVVFSLHFFLAFPQLTEGQRLQFKLAVTATSMSWLYTNTCRGGACLAASTAVKVAWEKECIYFFLLGFADTQCVWKVAAML